jgi:hypothetical protein
MCQAKRDTAYGEKPEAVKTHLRNMVIVLLGEPKKDGVDDMFIQNDTICQSWILRESFSLVVEGF